MCPPTGLPQGEAQQPGAADRLGFSARTREAVALLLGDAHAAGGAAPALLLPLLIANHVDPVALALALRSTESLGLSMAGPATRDCCTQWARRGRACCRRCP